MPHILSARSTPMNMSPEKRTRRKQDNQTKGRKTGGREQKHLQPMALRDLLHDSGVGFQANCTK